MKKNNIKAIFQFLDLGLGHTWFRHVSQRVTVVDRGQRRINGSFSDTPLLPSPFTAAGKGHRSLASQQLLAQP